MCPLGWSFRPGIFLSSSAHSTGQEAGCWEKPCRGHLVSKSLAYHQLYPDAFATFAFLRHFQLYTLYLPHLADNVLMPYMMTE